MLEPNSSAGLLVWEEMWATPLVEALREAAGVLLQGVRIPRESAVLLILGIALISKRSNRRLSNAQPTRSRASLLRPGMAAWALAGAQLSHYAQSQAQLGTPVNSPALLLPGDLVSIPGADGTRKAPGHVGTYLGDGYIIEAPQTGDVVKIVALTAFGPIAAMRRYG